MAWGRRRFRAEMRMGCSASRSSALRWRRHKKAGEDDEARPWEIVLVEKDPSSLKRALVVRIGASDEGTWIDYVAGPRIVCAEQERRLRRANLEAIAPLNPEGLDSENEDGDDESLEFAAAQRKRSPLPSSSSSSAGLLIPGLPDDVAQLCLMRLPCVKYCPSYRLVSKSWRAQLSSEEFYAARRALGIRRVSVCFVVHGNRVRVFDTQVCQWFSLPPLPRCSSTLPDDVCVDPYDWWRIDTVAAAEGNLFVIGGDETHELASRPSNRVHRYDFCSGRWREVAPMAVARSHSAAVTVGERVYVAGGAGGGGGWAGLGGVAPSSAEVYNPALDAWDFVSGMNTAMRACVGLEHRGKVLVKGENVGPGSPLEGEVYDPDSDLWVRMLPKLKAGLARGPTASAGSRIFVADWKDLELKVFNFEFEAWDVVGQLPARLSRLVSHDDQHLYGFTGKIKVDPFSHRVISDAPAEVWRLDIGRGWECIWREAKLQSAKVGALTWAPCSAHCALLQD